MHSVLEYANIFITLLAIIDPWGAVPVFLSLTKGQSRADKVRTAWLAALTVALVLMGSALLGSAVLHFLGIRIASFRIAGGLLLLLMGMTMLQGSLSSAVQHPEEMAEAEEKENVAVIPLAIPLLSGPGAISSMTIYAQHDRTWQHVLVLLALSLVLALVTGLILRLAEPVGKGLGKTGVKIMIRLMGLLLAAAGVQFIMDGLAQLFPHLV